MRIDPVLDGVPDLQHAVRAAHPDRLDRDERRAGEREGAHGGGQTRGRPAVQRLHKASRDQRAAGFGLHTHARRPNQALDKRVFRIVADP